MIQGTVISKEEIAGHHFGHQEVLSNPDAIAQRRSDLEKAMKLGNTEHNKVKIVFESTNGIFVVETTIWSVTQNNVMLKGNTLIPIHCIRQISFFD
jgi:hypothetical protein